MKSRITEAKEVDGQLVVSIDVIDDNDHVCFTRLAGLPPNYSEKDVRLAQDNALNEYAVREANAIEHGAKVVEMQLEARAAAEKLMASDIVVVASEDIIQPVAEAYREEMAAATPAPIITNDSV